MDGAMRFRAGRSRVAPHKTRARTNHRMAPAHDINALDQLIYSWMSDAQIVQNHIDPALPVQTREPRPCLPATRFAQRIIVGEDRRPVIQSALMRGDDI